MDRQTRSRKASRLLHGSLFLSLFAIPLEGRAWNPIGHRMIAETAALLLDDELKSRWGDLLANQRFALGVYSNQPDTLFRSIDGGGGKIEAPTHYFDLDLVLETEDFKPSHLKELARIPEKYPDAVRYLNEKIGKEKTLQAGSAPWRIRQLQALAATEFRKTKKVPSGYQSARDSKEDARHVAKGLFYLGVLSHYTGDASMPYHATSDYNGWQTGNGGIHFFYEGDCVDALEPGLSKKVLKAARKYRGKWLKSWSERPVLGAYLDSAMDIEEIRKIDTRKAVTAPSKVSGKEFAKRKAPEKACPAFESQLVKHLAKGAVLTAHLWRQALPQQTDFASGAPLQFSDWFNQPEYIKPPSDPSYR